MKGEGGGREATGTVKVKQEQKPLTVSGTRNTV